MVTVRLTERFAFSGGKVDREAGTIADCLICGVTSENGRDYPWGGPLRGDCKKYEGAPSNCDHGKEDTIDRRLGWFTDVAPGDDGRPRGTYHLLKSHPMYERVIEAAEKNPRLFGFSHVIEARTSRKNGREIVESIERVISIDLVATPATTRGIFENKPPQASIAWWEKYPVANFSLKQFGERFGPKWGPVKWSAFTRLCEEMGPMADAPVMDEPPAEADTGDMKSALMSALAPMLDEAFESGDATKVVAALKDFVKLHAKHTGKGGGGDEEPPKEEPKPESKPLTIGAITEATDLLDQNKLPHTLLPLLLQQPEAGRKAFAETLKKLHGAGAGGAGERPESAGRKPVTESVAAAGGAKVPTGKDFLRTIKR